MLKASSWIGDSHARTNAREEQEIRVSLKITILLVGFASLCLRRRVRRFSPLVRFLCFWLSVFVCDFFLFEILFFFFFGRRASRILVFVSVSLPSLSPASPYQKRIARLLVLHAIMRTRAS